MYPYYENYPYYPMPYPDYRDEDEGEYLNSEEDFDDAPGFRHHRRRRRCCRPCNPCFPCSPFFCSPFQGGCGSFGGWGGCGGWGGGWGC